MSDEKVIFDVVIDGTDTPSPDETGVSYRVSTGTRSSNEVKVYSGDDGTIVDGQMTILTPSSDIDDELIMSGDITPTDIFDPLATHLRGVGIVTGIPDVPSTYCLETTGDVGLGEYGIFENDFTLSNDWKVKFSFNLDNVATETNSYVSTGSNFKLLLAPSINRVQIYYPTNTQWFNFDLTTDIGKGTGQHTVEIFQNGTNVRLILDNGAEIPDNIDGIILAPNFTHMFTNAVLGDKFVGQVNQIIYYNGGVEVRKYTFNSESTVEELCDITSEALTYTNVATASWVTCDGGEEPTEPDPDPIQDTYLEYRNSQDSRFIDAEVVDSTANIGYPRIAMAEGPSLIEADTAEPNQEALKKYDLIHMHSFKNILEVMAAIQSSWDKTKYLKQINIEFLDKDEGADDGTLYQARNPSFIFTGDTSSPTDGTMFAGHWLYQASSETSSYLSNSALSVSVASTNYMSVGKYVVICDADWSNAEHLRISNISGNTIYFDIRGYRSDQLVHNSGSRIAVHVHFNPSSPVDFMYNVSIKCPVDGAGRQCNDWFALWASNNLSLDNYGDIVDGLFTDGVAFDIDFKDQTHAADFDNDGDNDIPTDANNNWIWEGLDTLYDYCRSYMPTKTITSGLSRSPGYSHNHGTQEEGWPVDIRSEHNVVADDDYNDVFNQIFSNYTLRMREARQPYSDWHIISKNVSDIYGDAQLTGTQIFDTDSCSYRVALTTALMGPAMYCQQPGSTAGWYTGRSYDPWYDEFSVDINTGICWKGGEWYDRDGATPETRDSFEDIISGKHWLGQPLETFNRVFTDADFDADDVIYDHAFDIDYTGWVGTQIPLSIESESLKCGEHTVYQSSADNAKVVGPDITLVSGNRYTFVFKAKTTTYREIIVRIGSTVQRKFDVSDEWRNYVFTFQATSTSMYTQFSLGKDSTIIWIKDVKVFPGEVNAFQRQFEHGIVLANLNFTSKTFALPADTYKRLTGYMSPTVNSGADVGTSIVIPALDGIILLRKTPDVPTSSTYLEWENDISVRRTDSLAATNHIAVENSKGYPRVSLAGGPAPTEMTTDSLKRYDLVLAHAYDQTNIAAAQVGWEHMRHIRQVNLEYLDWDYGGTGVTYQARQPNFSYTGGISDADGIIFAGHWLYTAGTTTTQALTTGASSVFVPSGDTGKFTIGQYVCIHNGTFWPAEHFKITSINGSTGELGITDRGYRGVAQYHASGSSIAMHSLGARDTSSEENFFFNMSSKCPKDGAGRKCNQWMAYWIHENNTLNHLGAVTSGLSTQGIGVDIDFKSQLHTADYNNDGVNDAGADGDENWLWEGLDEFFREARRIMPTKTITGGVSRSPGYAAYNGCQEENWPFEGVYEHTIIDTLDEAEAYKRFDWVMNNYITRMREVVGPQDDTHCLYKNPSAVYPDTPGLANNNKAFRLSLTTCLMGNAMFGQQPGDNSSGRSHDPWYDEFSVDITTGTALKAGEWYDSGLNGYSPDTWQDVIDNKYWLGQPVEDFQRDFDDADFQSGDVIYNHPFSSNYTGWNGGSYIPLEIENASLKCGKHSTYQSDINTAKVTGPAITTVTDTWYTFVFKARATRYRNISIMVDSFQVKLDLTKEWRNYSFSFKATDTSTSMYFGLGLDSTDVWFKDIKVFPGEINAFHREFDNGIVLANANNSSHTFTLPASTYKRILGYQDATVNSGAAVGTSIVIDSHDGIILVKI